MRQTLLLSRVRVLVTRISLPFLRMVPQRARRGEELVRRELMSECTFRPKIKGLPQVCFRDVFFSVSLRRGRGGVGGRSTKTGLDLY